MLTSTTGGLRASTGSRSSRLAPLPGHQASTLKDRWEEKVTVR